MSRLRLAIGVTIALVLLAALGWWVMREDASPEPEAPAVQPRKERELRDPRRKKSPTEGL